METLRVEDFRLPDGYVAAPKSSASPMPSKVTRRFIQRLPLDWVERAMQLPGHALHVALWLWYRGGLERTREGIPLCLAKIPIPHASARRGLAALEVAGLIAVERHATRSPRVTILEAPR